MAEFLNQHSFLLPLLDEAVHRLRDHFSDSLLRLEVAHDPEAVGLAQLELTVLTNGNVRQAMDRLDQFDAAWWAGNATRADGLLCIDLDFA